MTCGRVAGGPARCSRGKETGWCGETLTPVTAGAEEDEKSGEVNQAAWGTKRAEGGLRSKRGVR